MKKLLFLLLALSLVTSLSSCNDSWDRFEIPYGGPTGSPEPGYPHGDQGDEDHW